ncbi:MAG: hypothetical protein ACO1OB_17025 [Archangium sp.]
MNSDPALAVALREGGYTGHLTVGAHFATLVEFVNHLRAGVA